MKPEVEIYDTTLRDGSQGEGINLSVMDKLRITERLDAFGVHFIEGGWPGSNPKDIEYFAEAKGRRWKNARLAAFGSTRRKGKRRCCHGAGQSSAHQPQETTTPHGAITNFTHMPPQHSARNALNVGILPLH